MSPIRPTSSTLLAEALASLRRKPARAADTGASTSGASGPVGLRERLAALVAEAASRDDDALRAHIVRCILADQWGEGAADDPLFLETAAAVERDLRARPELDRLFREAVAALAVAPPGRVE